MSGINTIAVSLISLTPVTMPMSASTKTTRQTDTLSIVKKSYREIEEKAFFVDIGLVYHKQTNGF